ncbi:hypothetical protein PtB15_13B306 [Puccinia triticina]|nr:hypothetical protein PtB15_13B306 [Puccinia triticina]
MSSTLAHCYTVNLRALDFCGVHLMAGMTYRARGIVVGGGNLPVLHYNCAVISDTPLDDPFAFADPVNITGVGTICDVKAYRSRFTCEGVITEVTLEHKAQVARAPTAPPTSSEASPASYLTSTTTSHSDRPDNLPTLTADLFPACQPPLPGPALPLLPASQ